MGAAITSGRASAKTAQEIRDVFDERIRRVGVRATKKGTGAIRTRPLDST